MKKLAITAAFLFALTQIAAAQKNAKTKINYNDSTRVLTRTNFIEVVEVIDTARLYQERARLLAEKEKIEAQLDSNSVQIKEARRLMRGGKKGNGNNGNNRAAEAPAVPPATTPTPTDKPAPTKPKSKAKKQ